MATVTMLRQVSGTRNGKPWPAPGETVDLPQGEAEGLVSLGVATGDIPDRGKQTRTDEPDGRQATNTPKRAAKKAAAKKAE